VTSLVAFFYRKAEAFARSLTTYLHFAVVNVLNVSIEKSKNLLNVLPVSFS